MFNEHVFGELLVLGQRDASDLICYVVNKVVGWCLSIIRFVGFMLGKLVGSCSH